MASPELQELPVYQEWRNCYENLKRLQDWMAQQLQTAYAAPAEELGARLIAINTAVLNRLITINLIHMSKEHERA